MTTPGKTTLGYTAQMRINAALHAIAPGREIELAEALPELIEMLKDASPPFVWGSGPYNEWDQRREQLLARFTPSPERPKEKR